MTALRSSARTIEKRIEKYCSALACELRRQGPDGDRITAMVADFNVALADLRAVVDAHARADVAICDTAQGHDPVHRYFRHAARLLPMLTRIGGLVSRVARYDSSSLYPWAPPKHSLEGAQRIVSDAMMRVLHRVVNPGPQTELSALHGCFRDIPLESSDFIAHAHAAYRTALAQKRADPVRFLDVGCGCGMKLLAAREMFGLCDGFDFDPAYVEIATSAIRNADVSRCRAFHADALTFEGYAAYDIIYFYQPMQDVAGLRAMEDRIVAQVRTGTILIAPYAQFLSRAEGLGCPRLAGAVHVAGLSVAEADHLREAALRIGPDILHADYEFAPGGRTWLRDLRVACAMNGHLPD